MIARSAGLSDGGLYAHFPSKRDLYDALLADAGPDAVQAVITELLPDRDVVPDDPRDFLTMAVDRIMAAWATARARKFSRLLLREGIPAEPRLVTTMIGTGAAALGPLFEAWADRGLLNGSITADLRAGNRDGEGLTWELLAPLAFVRLVYLHGDADIRSDGEVRAASHLAFFLDVMLGPD